MVITIRRVATLLERLLERQLFLEGRLLLHKIQYDFFIFKWPTIATTDCHFR